MSHFLYSGTGMGLSWGTPGLQILLLPTKASGDQDWLVHSPIAQIQQRFHKPRQPSQLRLLWQTPPVLFIRRIFIIWSLPSLSVNPRDKRKRTESETANPEVRGQMLQMDTATSWATPPSSLPSTFFPVSATTPCNKGSFFSQIYGMVYGENVQES